MQGGHVVGIVEEYAQWTCGRHCGRVCTVDMWYKPIREGIALSWSNPSTNRCQYHTWKWYTCRMKGLTSSSTQFIPVVVLVQRSDISLVLDQLGWNYLLITI